MFVKRRKDAKVENYKVTNQIKKDKKNMKYKSLLTIIKAVPRLFNYKITT